MSASPLCARLGHECDECDRCLTGKCCRRESGYRLPELGSWTPYFGTIGVRNLAGDRIECHVCGTWWEYLTAHLRAHGLNAQEYRALFGLGFHGLQGDRLRRVFSGNAAISVLTNPGPLPTREQMTGGRERQSPEGRSHATARIGRRGAYGFSPETCSHGIVGKTKCPDCVRALQRVNSAAYYERTGRARRKAARLGRVKAG